MFRPINRHISDSIAISFNDQRLKEASTQVWLHEHLQWTPHANSLLADLARTGGCLSKTAYVPLN